MTDTTKAYPALPDAGHRGPIGTGTYFDAYTADQMRAYADATCALRHPLAAAADAGVSDEQILKAWVGFSVWGFATAEDRIARARELLALRPAQIAHDVSRVNEAAGSEREAARSEGFNAGTVAALAVLRLYDNEVQWREVLEAAGSGPVLQYAAHIEPEDWTWAGFDKYIGKKPKRDDAPARVNEAAGSGKDWRLPFDVTIGAGTWRKGVKFSSLMLYVKSLYKRLHGIDPDEVASRTPEQRSRLMEHLLNPDPRPAHEQMLDVIRAETPGADVLNMVVGAAPAHEAQGHGGVEAPDMTPPATSRDRWMYRQGWLAAMDPRSHAAPAEAGSGQGAQEGGV